MALIRNVNVNSTQYDIASSAIPFGKVDATSTSTVFTATVPGITELTDGVCIYLTNGVVTSASGWTLNVNNLGALPVYQSQAAASRVTTVFNVAYTGLFIYNSSRVSGGCWDYFYGYNSDTNTTAYQIRAYQTLNVMHAALTRYKICFTRFDGTILPATATSNSTGTTKTLTTESFDPHGLIYYYSTTTGVEANASPGASYMWLQYPSIDLRYSFNAGSTLTAKEPVYIKCSPQSDGSFKLAGNDCIVQSLPSTADNYAYLYLGKAYSTYQISLDFNHPIYCYRGGKIHMYTSVESELDAIPTTTSDLINDSGYITDAGVTSFNGNTGAITYTAPVTSVNGQTGDVTVSVPSASTTTPNMDGTASAGSGTTWARADHIHPTDTSRMAANLKGTANGVAELDANGKVPTSQLPSYVDDVLEYNATTDFPATGETGKIYVATSTNLTYRWSGSGYVEISPSLALGETSSTAYAGDKGKIAYDTAAAALPKAGGTMSGAIAMGNNKITGLANGTDNTDAATVGQLPTKVSDLTNDSGFVTDADLVNADWAEDDSTDASYVANRPAIRAGEGENSIVEGVLEDADDTAVYTLTINGEANAASFSYTTTDTISVAQLLNNLAYVYFEEGSGNNFKIRRVKSISNSMGNVSSSGTIILNGQLSTTAITDGTLLVCYRNPNRAISNYSHVEGRWTATSGIGTHAEGTNSVASGTSSHAEGSATTASGNSAHAEGGNTTASGSYSHAEGSNNVAAGTRSHAEGYYTIANGSASHVEGKFNIADTYLQDTYAHIVGNGTADDARSNAYTLDWSGNGVYAGKVTVGTGPTNNMDVATKQYVDSNVGVTSFNGNTGAVTYTAPVTSVNGQTGAVTVTTANADWEEDDSTDASYVENRPAIRAGEGENSVVEGNFINADPVATYTLKISGDSRGTTFSFTTEDELPIDTIIKQSIAYYANGSVSHMTYLKVVSIDRTTNKITLTGPIGTSSVPLSNADLLLLCYSENGGANIAAGEYSHAEGKFTIASGQCAHTEGWNTIAGAARSHAEGSNTKAINSGGHAEGSYTIASGIYAHAEGSHTTASGQYAHAEGRDSEASGSRSHAEGSGTIAAGNDSHVEGKFNIEDSQSTYSHIVGNGTADDARSNAYTLDWSGNGVYAGKVTVGTGPTANMDVATKQYVDNSIPSVPTPSITTPLMDGTASVGLEKGQYALADHVHPSDTSKSGVVLKVWVADAEVQV